MKLAITGMRGEGKLKQLAKDIVTEWAGAFATPADDIDKEELEIPWQNTEVTEEAASEQYGNLGAYYYNLMLYLNGQYDKFKEHKNIVYACSPLDVLAEALTAAEMFPDEVTELDTIIYWFKRAITKLDLIYILPPKHDNKGEEPKEEVKITEQERFTQRYEQILNGLWIQYADNFEKAGIYPVDDCPGIAILETEEPISEIRMVVDRHGNLAAEDSPEQVQKLYDSIKDKRLLDNVKDILSKPEIPLVGTPKSNIII